MRQETQDIVHTGITPHTLRLATVPPQNLKNPTHIDSNIVHRVGTLDSSLLDVSFVLDIHGGNGIAKANRISLSSPM
jgi:hypothetical protein